MARFGFDWQFGQTLLPSESTLFKDQSMIVDNSKCCQINKMIGWAIRVLFKLKPKTFVVVAGGKFGKFGLEHHICTELLALLVSF